jgi:poly(3-hydroxybutyrate) depolymerase
MKAPASAALAAAGLAAALLPSACDTPSSHVDGTDLHGVFERASASASATASAPAASASARGAARRKRDAGAPRPPPLVRQPPAGPCLESSGTAASSDRRVARRPACRGGNVAEWRDARGAPRYACLFESRQAADAPLPLILFFHDAHDNPTAVHRKTTLRKHYRRFDLTGDSKRLGFRILAPQGRRLSGVTRFDLEHRSADNLDVVAVDHFLDELIASGKVDTRRIYAMGAAQGGNMAAMYAMLRPARIAAFATFASNAAELRWSCDAPQPPAAVLYRACDSEQPCSKVERWLDARESAGAPTLALRLGAANRSEPSCDTRCKPRAGLANHNRWPKGRERELLEYLGRFSLGR